MKKQNLRIIICIFVYTCLCISIFDFFRQFTNPHLHKDSLSMISQSNAYAVPAGVFTVCLLLVSGLFLFSICINRPSWNMILLIIAFGSLMINLMTSQSGEQFMPEKAYSILSWRGVQYIPSHAVILFLLLNQSQGAGRLFLRIFGLTITLLTSCFLVSFLFRGPFAKVMIHTMETVFLRGSLKYLLVVVTVLLLIICTIVSIYCFISECINAKTQATALLLKHDLTKECYLILKNNVNLYIRQLQQAEDKVLFIQNKLSNGYYNNLSKDLNQLSSMLSSAEDTSYCENELVNLLLTYYAQEAEKSQIKFTIDASVPKDLEFIQSDLSTFLINLIDNAFEASRLVPDPKTRFIQLKLNYENHMLSILCKNAYSGSLKNDYMGNLKSTKSGLNRNACGLEQIKMITKKYHSTLSIQNADHIFTVQTTLHFDDEK